MKSIGVVMLMGAMMISGLAQAADIRFSNADPSGDAWMTPGNWVGGVVPGSADKARFNYGGAAGTLYTVAPTIDALQIGVDEPGGLTIASGGQLTVDSGEWSAVGYNRSGTLTIEEGGSMVCDNYMAIGMFDDGPEHKMELILDGSLTVTDAFYLGLYFDGNAGAITEIMATAVINGTLDVEGMGVAINCQVDLRWGTIIINGDQTGNVASWIGDDRLVAFGGNGTIEADYDTTNSGRTTIKAIHPMDPSPEMGEIVPAGNVDLIWTHLDPNHPGATVTVDVWFGTDPNKLSLGYSQVLTGSSAQTVTVSAPTPGTYYWQVDSYTGAPEMVEGDVFSFDATNDSPPTVEAGISMDTWVDQPVQLDATITDDGVSPIAILWTADDPTAVFSDDSIEDPTVTVDNAAGQINLTLTVQDGLNPPVSDIVQITVYDDACDAARRGDGRDQLYPGDFNGDCIIDLTDFATEIAAKWLDDYALTEPIPYD